MTFMVASGGQDSGNGNVHRRCAFRWACAAAVPAGLVALAFVLPKVAGSGWLADALSSRLFVVSGLILFSSALLLAAAGIALWRAAGGQRARRAGIRSGQSGQAFIEFAMVLPIALVLVLVMAQSSLLMGGNLCVHYAAYCAARSAIVTVPDEVALAEPPNVLADTFFPSPSAKMRRIHMAAVWAVMPVSASGADLPAGDVAALEDGLERFFDLYGRSVPGWVRRHFARKMYYADENTTVELAPPADGQKYGEHEDLSVKVQHTLYLSVPYANWLFATLMRDGVDLDFGTGEYGMNIHATCRLTNEGVQDFVDVESFGSGS